MATVTAPFHLTHILVICGCGLGFLWTFRPWHSTVDDKAVVYFMYFSFFSLLYLLGIATVGH